MTPRKDYHVADYIEDTALSEDLHYRRGTEYAKVSPKLRAVTIIAPLVIFSSVLIGFPLMIAAGLTFFVVMVLFIIRFNREGDKILADCPSCGVVMRREECAGLEYHVCDTCKIYGRGRDWS